MEAQNVMFICTKCKQILKLDDSLTNITDNDLNKFKVIKFEDEMIPNDSMKAIDVSHSSIFSNLCLTQAVS